MFIAYILPACILISSVIDDLRSKKIHNYLILIQAGVAVISVLIIKGPMDLFYALALMVLSLLITIPLVLLKVIGGGDMKLFAVLALVLPPQLMLWTFIASFVWGALLGVVKALLDKKALLLYFNMLFLLKFKPPSAEQLHTFPFSVSLLLGWLSALWF